MTGENLSHEEVWDDSALQESWDDALAEYKKYHSMAAKGEQVDVSQINGDKEMEPEPESASNTPQHHQYQPTDLNDTATQASHTTSGAQARTEHPAATSTVPPTNTIPATAPPAQQGAPAAMPQALLNSVQDEGMKNLMMSWYYAGYYTGLLEGQQKAFASMQETD
ncbi:hypothetical protein Q7P37_009093 [Cladosporium fusiforme]